MKEYGLPTDEFNPVHLPLILKAIYTLGIEVYIFNPDSINSNTSKLNIAVQISKFLIKQFSNKVYFDRRN